MSLLTLSGFSATCMSMKNLLKGLKLELLFTCILLICVRQAEIVMNANLPLCVHLYRKRWIWRKYS